MLSSGRMNLSIVVLPAPRSYQTGLFGSSAAPREPDNNDGSTHLLRLPRGSVFFGTDRTRPDPKPFIAVVIDCIAPHRPLFSRRSTGLFCLE
mmetsp:Transcript_24789/g.54549  ORF Transcript_24789/g.54549 Transcript_24789/m.54549 type:complete len:92 (-) Transcript_24789:245-520(-)